MDRKKEECNGCDEKEGRWGTELCLEEWVDENAERQEQLRASGAMGDNSLIIPPRAHHGHHIYHAYHWC